MYDPISEYECRMSLALARVFAKALATAFATLEYMRLMSAASGNRDADMRNTNTVKYKYKCVKRSTSGG